MTGPRRRAALLLAPLALAGCGSAGPEGALLLLDPHYSARLIAAPGGGIAMADGLRWRDGKLLVADEGGSAFRIWGGGNDVRTLADARAGIDSPEDFVLDPEANIFFTDDDAGGVWRIDPQGKTTLLAGKDKGLVSTEGIAMMPSGALLVGDGKTHRIFRVERDGAVSLFIGPERGISKPESMVYDDEGNLYIADNEDETLYLLAKNGRLYRVIEQGGFSPETLLYSGGVLYITDSHNGRLYRYTPHEGLKAMAIFAAKLSVVTGITTDPAGNIYLGINIDPGGGVGAIVRLDRRHPRGSAPSG